MLCTERTMLSRDVCKAVKRRYSVETAEHILNLFFTVGYSHSILVCPHQAVWQYSEGDPLTVVSNAGGMKNRDFRPASRSVSKTIQDK